MKTGTEADLGRILVTGAGGFIGSHLATDLASRGNRVVALDVDLERIRHLETRGRFELLEGDLTDPETRHRALRCVDTVFHLAAAHLGAALGVREFRRVNVDATRELAREAVSSGVRRFVHCSSVGVYGRIERPPANEDSPCNPELDYEVSKLAGERVVLEVAREGLPVVIIRPVWVYGPGCPRTEKLFRAIGRGRFVVGGNGHNLRHCIYIRDLVAALRLTASADAAVGQVIIIGDSQAVTVRQLVDRMARLIGGRRPPSVPLPLLRLAALTAELLFRFRRKEPPISRRTLRFFTGSTSFDTSRARMLLGFEAAYALDRGLAETYRLLRQDPPWRLGDGVLDGSPAGCSGADR